MEYRVLGPIEVLAAGGEKLALGGAMQQSVLASLLLRAGQTVALDRLIDDLWDEPPETAARTIQAYVSRLRHELPDGAIESRRGGYRLVLDGAELDLEMFERQAGEGNAALAAGDHEQAADLLRGALALWRGPALVGLNSAALRREAQRLEELRLSVLEERIEADLGCGRHGELVAELTAFVNEHPFRERPRAQLMRALYYSGRPGDALEVYREGRRMLVDELGMEPGQELRELEQAVLRQDPELEAPRLKPSTSAAAPLPVQREPQVEQPLDASESHAGTVTFLFTDIEGSTRLLKQLRSGYAEVLAQHREVLREAFREHGGVEIDAQGDAFFVCFRRAKHAVAAAAAAQRGLAVHVWPEGAELRVRIGIHTGEAELSDGRYHGVAVHRAARIMAAAHGGQVLVSQTTRDLIEDAEEEAIGIEMRDLGAQRLKDLDRPVHLYQLDIEGLPSEFPPIRTEADLGAGAEATLAPPPFYRKRTVLVGALAGVIAAAVAIPIFALGSGGSASAAVTPNSVVELDAKTGKVVKDVPVGTAPGPVAAGEGSVWTANLDDKTVTQINPRTGQRVVDIPTAHDGGPPTGIGVGFGTLWVTYGNNGRVDRIDPRSQEIVKTFHVHEELGLRNSQGARVLAVARHAVWLGNLDATIEQISPDNNKVREKIPVGGGHNPAIAVDPDGSLWEAAENENTVWHIDPATGSQIGSKVGISGVITAIVPTRKAVWVTDATRNQLVEINPSGQTIEQRIGVGANPTAATVADGFVWVANSGNGTLSEIDPRHNNHVTTIRLGNVRPSGIAFADGRLWVSISKRLPLSTATRPPDDIARVLLPGVTGPDEIDPAALDNFNGSGFPWWVSYATCAKLLNYPDKPGKAGLRLVPEVAKAKPVVSNGGKTYTFTVRTGSAAFRFSPPWNTPVTAATFKYSIERTLAPVMHSDAALQGFLDDVAGARAYENGDASHISGIEVHGNKLTFRLVRRAPDFSARISMPQFCAVPIDFPIQIGKSAIPGAGPYYVSASSSEGIILRENPNYHGSRPHHFKEIDLVPGVTVAQVEGGKADFTFAYPPDLQRLIKRFGPGTAAAKVGHQRLFPYPVSSTLLLALNTSRPLFRSATLRRAVSYAIDRNALSAIWGGSLVAPVFEHYLVPEFPGATAAHVYPPRPNLAEARRLAAGRTGQAIFYTPQELPDLEATVAKDLKAIGIDVVPKPFAFSVAIAKAQTRGAPFDLALGFWYPYYPDPAAALNPLLSGGAIRKQVSTNDAYFNDPTYNRKLAAASKLTGAARLSTFGRLDIEIARREAPYVTWARVVNPAFYSARIGCKLWSPVPHYELDLAALCLRK